MTILNLTQHSATAEQKAAGVVDPPEELKQKITKFLTVEEPPQTGELDERASLLADVAVEFFYHVGGELDPEDPFHNTWVLIGGAPWLMVHLEGALRMLGFCPVYAFSRRVSVEKSTPEGVVKTSVFKHAGFITRATPQDSHFVA